MGENGEESSAECVELDKQRLPDQDLRKEEDVTGCEEGQVKEEKKSSDELLQELFSSIRPGTVVDVAEVITEVSRSRKERGTRDKSRSRSRSHDRKHKHKKNKKEKKPKKHRSRSRSNDRKRRHRSRSSSPRFAKTGTLADIRINTKTKNLDDLKNTVPVTSTTVHDDEDDELPVGADYRTVMAEAVASSEPSTSQGPSLADLPTAKKMEPAFPLKKSDGEKKDAIEEKSSPMLKKVMSEKGGALLVPRKIQIDSSKNNGSPADSFGPAPPPVVKDESKEDEEEDVEMTASLAIKSPPKIAFGQISLKVNGSVEKKEEGNGVKKEDSDEKMEVDENAKMEEKMDEKKEEKSEDKDKKAAKKMAVRRRRSSSVDKKDKDKKERKRSRSRSKDRRDRDRSRDKGRDGRRDSGRSNERNRRDDRRRRSRSRSAERRRDDRDRDRRGRRSRSPRDRRSRSKSREKIDKKKLLEIALQNARGVSGPVAEKQGVNMKILEKAGGRNIGDIVSYCQKLSETENAEKLGGGGRADSDDDDFSYKSKKEIKMNIPGSKQLPTSTPQERLLDTAPLRTAFPVSSGVIHRDNTKESMSEWKKVDPNAAVPSVCTPLQKKLVATSSLNKIKAENEGRSVPVAAFPILPPPPAPPTIRGDLIPPPPPPPMFNSSSLVPPPPMPPTIITPSHDRLIRMPDSGYDEVRK